MIKCLKQQHLNRVSLYFNKIKISVNIMFPALLTHTGSHISIHKGMAAITRVELVISCLSNTVVLDACALRINGLVQRTAFMKIYNVFNQCSKHHNKLHS
jgi:hypothetical protein